MIQTLNRLLAAFISLFTALTLVQTPAFAGNIQTEGFSSPIREKENTLKKKASAVAATKKELTAEAYERWKRIEGPMLSNDG